MPSVVLVHGVPDTSRLWSALRTELARSDVLALDLPGFGVPLPPGFVARDDDYAAWIVDQLERVGEPVDLVGHDWGAILAQRVTALRPDLVRTLACGSGPVDAEYVWHETAQLWQTPGVGEQMMEGFSGETAAAMLAIGGMPADYAALATAQIDAVMRKAILALYRSAVDVGTRWEPAMHAVRRPTLVIWATDDPYVDIRFGERLAARTNGQLLRLDGGHWWPVTRPAQVARALTDFWRR